MIKYINAKLECKPEDEINLNSLEINLPEGKFFMKTLINKLIGGPLYLITNQTECIFAIFLTTQHKKPRRE